jgi:hypothetical protein
MAEARPKWPHKPLLGLIFDIQASQYQFTTAMLVNVTLPRLRGAPAVVLNQPQRREVERAVDHVQHSRRLEQTIVTVGVEVDEVVIEKARVALAATRGPLLRGFRIDPSRGGARVARLSLLSCGPVEIDLRRPLTFLVGENGSGKTTLLEAIATRCAIHPNGGRSYAETDDERDETALSAAVGVVFSGRRPKGLFVRADRLSEAVARAGRLPCPRPMSGAWRMSRAGAKVSCHC